MSLLVLLAAAAALLPCSYRAAGDEEIAPHGPCATSTTSGVRIEPKHLRRLDFGPDGLASVFIDGLGWIYVKRGGDTLSVLAADNGPDEFSEDRVRVSRGGKIGFADRSFRVVIPLRYDFGWPFERGRALVCIGCKAAPAAAAVEHPAVTGGAWGYVDRDGREIVPVARTREEALGMAERVDPPPAFGCRLADARIESAIARKAASLGGIEYCQFRRYEALSDLDGDGHEDLIVLFNVEPASGTNDHRGFLAVFLTSDSPDAEPLLVSTGGRGERDAVAIRVVGRRITLETLEYLPNDPMCCPSGHGEIGFDLEGRALKPVRPGRPAL